LAIDNLMALTARPPWIPPPSAVAGAAAAAAAARLDQEFLDGGTHRPCHVCVLVLPQRRPELRGTAAVPPDHRQVPREELRVLAVFERREAQLDQRREPVRDLAYVRMRQVSPVGSTEIRGKNAEPTGSSRTSQHHTGHNSYSPR
jgi:hypothetical protein